VAKILLHLILQLTVEKNFLNFEKFLLTSPQIAGILGEVSLSGGLFRACRPGRF
jgi:hypothetical protein